MVCPPDQQIERCPGKARATHIFHDDCAFMTSPIPMSESWHESEGIDFQQRLRFLVRINLDVLVVHILDL